MPVPQARLHRNACADCRDRASAIRAAAPRRGAHFRARPRASRTPRRVDRTYPSGRLLRTRFDAPFDLGEDRTDFLGGRFRAAALFVPDRMMVLSRMLVGRPGLDE